MPNLRPAQSQPRICERGDFEARVRRIEARQFLLTAICAALIMALVLSIFNRRQTTAKAAESPGVLRLKGLVIEDEQGRARVLLGAPFPAVADRNRQDATTSAMVFLDEQGHDRFAVGEKLAPQIAGAVPANYRSPGTGYGVTLFDPTGNERGEMGFLCNGKSGGRAVVALDRPQGDAIGAIVDDSSGYAGLAALYPNAGNAPGKTGILLGTQGNKAFLSMQDAENRPRASLTVESKRTAAFQVFDEDGRPGPNFLHPSDRAMTDTR
jgi:hypothetical protein